MKSRYVQHTLSAVTALGLIACAGTEEADEPVTMESEGTRVLAETEIPGGHARFVAFDAQTLLVVTDTVGVPRPLQDEEIRGLDAAQLYESWAAEAAPPELVALAAKTSRKAAPDVTTAPDVEGEAGVAGLSLALSVEDEDEDQEQDAAAFRENHCPEGDRQEFCFTGRTGEWEHSERARYWMGFVEAFEGDVSVQMRRRQAIGGWTTDWVTEVAEGHDEGFVATSDVLNQRPLKFKIFEADDSTWNFAGTWD